MCARTVHAHVAHVAHVAVYVYVHVPQCVHLLVLDVHVHVE